MEEQTRMPVHVFFFTGKDTNVTRATSVRVGRLPIIGGDAVDLTDPALECLDVEGNVVAAFILSQIVGYSITEPSSRRVVRRPS
jgi:hypothetical protein